MIKCPSLEVTGNFLEVPPAREPTNARAKPQRASMTVDSSTNPIQRRRSSLVSGASKSSSLNKTATPPTAPSLGHSATLQRSVSQQSTSKKLVVSTSSDSSNDVIIINNKRNF